MDKQKMLDAYNKYIAREFGHEPEEFPTDGIFRCAYTVDSLRDDEENEAHELQVNFNTNKMRWENFIDGKLVLAQSCDEECFVESMEAEFSDILRDCLYRGQELAENGEI